MNKTQARQKQIISFISGYMQKTGINPTIREIAEGVGLKSPSTVQYHLKILESQGIISWRQNCRRALEIPNSNSERAFSVPVFSDIRQVVASDKNTCTEKIFIPNKKADTFSKKERLFSVKMPDGSLTGAGILKNDIVILEPICSIEYNSLVAIFFDGEITIRYIEKGMNGLRFTAKNEAVDDILTDSVKILGKVVGIQRLYEN